MKIFSFRVSSGEDIGHSEYHRVKLWSHPEYPRVKILVIQSIIG